MKVLVADDQRSVRLLVEHTLKSWDYQTIGVENGAKALAMLHSDPEIQLAVLDWEMPGLSGVEVCRQLETFDRFVYAILLTGRTDKSDIAHALEAGASDYVAKLFDRAELRARLRSGERIITLQRQLAEMQKFEAAIADEITTPVQLIHDKILFLREAFEDLGPLLQDVRAAIDKDGGASAARVLEHAAGTRPWLACGRSRGNLCIVYAVQSDSGQAQPVVRRQGRLDGSDRRNDVRSPSGRRRPMRGQSLPERLHAGCGRRCRAIDAGRDECTARHPIDAFSAPRFYQTCQRAPRQRWIHLARAC